jgi:molecular chaperone GrpE
MSSNPAKDNPENIMSNIPSTEGSNGEDFVAPASEQDEFAEQLAKLREENKNLTDQILRKQAEFENVRRRIDREKEDFMQYSLFNAAKELLPILDGFDLALGVAGGGEDYRKGVELIHQQLYSALEKLGLKAVETKNREFDPHLHEAIAAVETDEIPENHIAEEFQRGYFFKDRLLRPARVKIAKPKPTAVRP